MTYRSKTHFIGIAGSLSLAGLAMLATALPPMPAVAAERHERLRCRDTLLGETCTGERGREIRCHDTLLGENCDDNRGGRTDCRDTLLGRDCETRGRRR